MTIGFAGNVFITFSASNNISGVMWNYSNISPVLTGSHKSASASFTIMTTSTTPLGLHKIAIRAASEATTSQEIFTLKVVE